LLIALSCASICSWRPQAARRTCCCTRARKCAAKWENLGRPCPQTQLGEHSGAEHAHSYTAGGGWAARATGCAHEYSAGDRHA
jgi:hypothetical protein